jgi:prepilin peptidase CpaA
MEGPPAAMPVSLQILPILIFPGLVILAALKDITSFTIPNWISGVLIVAFLVAAPVLGAPLSLLGQHLGIGVAGLILGMGMFALGWIGGGDAKLFAAACLWLGWPALTSFLLATTLAGGALAVILVGLRLQTVRAHTPVLAGWVERLTTPGAPAPYGVAIACGALFAFPGGDLMQLAHLAPGL